MSDKAIEALEALSIHGSARAAAIALGISRSAMRDRLVMAQALSAPQRSIAYTARLQIQIDNGIVVVFSDAHYFPGEPSTAHRALLKFIREFRPRGVVCNGDAFDGASISRWPRIGWDSKPTVKQELDVVTQRLGEVEDAAGTYAWKAWPLGNHDARFETFLASNSPQYEGVAGFALKDHFPRWMPCWRLDINAGDDDHTIVKHRWKGGIHGSRNNTLNAGTHFVTGHLHSMKVAPITDAKGTRYGVDTGTLADVYGDHSTDYTEDGIKDWRSGFVVLTYRNGRLLQPEMVQVVADGLVEFRGKEHAV